jgi:hypothetical protein
MSQPESRRLTAPSTQTKYVPAARVPELGEVQTDFLDNHLGARNVEQIADAVCVRAE